MKKEDLAPRLERLRVRFHEIEERLGAPDAYSDLREIRSLTRERNRLMGLFSSYDAWDSVLRELQQNQSLLRTEEDPELRALIESEICRCEEKASDCGREVLLALAPPDPDDSRNVIMEIRPGAGGGEASLFAAELLRAYAKYAELKKWQFHTLDRSENELGGLREATVSLAGDGVFSRLKYESGVHRVQRVPTTETGGRIHTSTVTVSVLPEAEEQDDVEIRPEDLEITTCRSSGPGGQNVNRTDSAVRIRHIPSGIVTASQQERSQIRNREIALRILRSKLLELQRREEAEKHAASVRAQIGTGDRSERIRTYNFPQNRVTDHRFGISAHDLPALLEGDFDQILGPIFEAEAERRMKRILEETT